MGSRRYIENKILDIISLDYSQAEMAVAARHEPWSCTHVPQMGRNEADRVRFGLPGGEKVAMIRLHQPGKKWQASFQWVIIVISW